MTDAVGTPLATDLSTLIFGATPDSDDLARWRGEGFVFSQSVKWGLRQQQGGPCGILAPVQAFIILYFMKQGVSVFQASSEEIEAGLMNALATMIWRSRPTGSTTAFWRGTPVDSLEGLVDQIVQDHLDKSGSVLHFVESLVTTRTIDQVKTDLNFDSEPLVRRFGHASQELVNLCLWGVAFSHQFDGKRTLAPNVEVYGTPCRGVVGFLSQMEVLQYQRVGNWSKCPEFPVWIIASSSHYSVLFALDLDVGKLTAAQIIEQDAIAIFAELDQSDSGFISSGDLGKLLTRLNRPDLIPSHLAPLVDPDELGVILWSDLWPVLSRTGSVRSSNRMKKNSDRWACSACTFINEPHNTICEICMTENVPVPVTESLPIASQDTVSQSAALQMFTLYHYNGIENHLGAKACCTQMNVTLIDSDGIPQWQSPGRGLREVIQTRWRGAIVEFEDALEPELP